MHDDIEMRAGDAWEIDGTLLDEGGAALDLTNASFNWMIRDVDGNPLISVVQAAQIAVIDASQGTVRIVLDHITTGTLAPGRYTDAIQVIIGGEADTEWTGQILVACNHFAPPGD